MLSPLSIIRIISLTSHAIHMLSEPLLTPSLPSPHLSVSSLLLLTPFMICSPSLVGHISVHLPTSPYPLHILSVSLRTSPHLSLHSLQQDDDALNLKLSSIDEKGADQRGNNGNTCSKASKGKASPVGLRSWLWASRPGVLHAELFQPTASTLDQVRGSEREREGGERGARGSERESERKRQADRRVGGGANRWGGGEMGG